LRPELYIQNEGRRSWEALFFQSSTCPVVCRPLLKVLDSVEQFLSRRSSIASEAGEPTLELSESIVRREG
jgi:hypothetical protein